MDDEEKERRKRLKEYGRRYREKHGIQKRSWRWKRIICIAFCICLAFGIMFLAAQREAEMKVTLDGKPISEMTDAEIRRCIDEREHELAGKEIPVKGDGIDAVIRLDEIGAHVDEAYIYDEVFLIGRKGMPWQRVQEIVSILQSGKDVPLALTADQTLLESCVQKICQLYDTKTENAYAVPNDDNKTVTIHKETNRIVIDGDALAEAVRQNLHCGEIQPVDAPVQLRETAAVTAEDLKNVDTVLSYYTTHFDESNQARNENIAIAQQRLNHAAVPAQESFSFNDYVGERTRDKGYKDAPVYFGNQLVPDAGGGVCQVSSTLFNAVLRAGLFIDSRAPHFAPAAYVPVGMDATVADNSLDFSFTNPFQNPICIYTVCGQGFITTYILGNHEDVCTTAFQTVSLKNLPHRVIRKHDDAAEGDVQEQIGYDGHDIVIRRTVLYADGDKYTDMIESHYEPNDDIVVTKGPASETIVQTSDLQAQDILLNRLHDMWI